MATKTLEPNKNDILCKQEDDSKSDNSAQSSVKTSPKIVPKVEDGSANMTKKKNATHHKELKEENKKAHSKPNYMNNFGAVFPFLNWPGSQQPNQRGWSYPQFFQAQNFMMANFPFAQSHMQAQLQNMQNMSQLQHQQNQSANTGNQAPSTQAPPAGQSLLQTSTPNVQAIPSIPIIPSITPIPQAPLNNSPQVQATTQAVGQSSPNNSSSTALAVNQTQPAQATANIQPATSGQTQGSPVLPGLQNNMQNSLQTGIGSGMSSMQYPNQFIAAQKFFSAMNGSFNPAFANNGAAFTQSQQINNMMRMNSARASMDNYIKNGFSGFIPSQQGFIPPIQQKKTKEENEDYNFLTGATINVDEIPSLFSELKLTQKMTLDIPNLLSNENMNGFIETVKKILEYFINYFGYKPKEEFDKELLSCFQDKDLVCEGFLALSERYGGIKKTKEENIKFVLRKAFKFMKSRFKTKNSLKEKEITKSFITYYFQNFGKTQEELETMVLPFRKSSQMKTMNHDYLRIIFSSPLFVKDYLDYFLDYFDQLSIEQNQKKIRIACNKFIKGLKSNDVSKIRTLRILPWLNNWIDETRKIAYSLMRYSNSPNIRLMCQRKYEIYKTKALRKDGRSPEKENSKIELGSAEETITKNIIKIEDDEKSVVSMNTCTNNSVKTPPNQQTTSTNQLPLQNAAVVINSMQIEEKIPETIVHACEKRKAENLCKVLEKTPEKKLKRSNSL